MLFEPVSGTAASSPTPRKASRRNALLAGGALALLAMAASTVLLVAQVTRLERALRPS